jgi:hypothetical protein
MNKKALAVSAIVFFLLATLSFSAKAATNKTVKDLVVKSVDDSDHEIKALKDGDTYTIDVTNAKFKKAKSGNKTMKLSDIKKGDILNVKGSYDSHDVTATEVRDLSTTKSASFYGVVTEKNDATQTVKIETPKRGKLTIAILKSTKVKYDGKTRKFSDIREDDKVIVTGTWNHSKKTITKTKKFYMLDKSDYDSMDD